MALVVAVVLGLLSLSSYSAAAVTAQIQQTTAVAVVATTVAVAKKKSISKVKKTVHTNRLFYLTMYKVYVII